MNTVREMVETGELWLGAIPATWTLARASTVMKERRERCSDTEYEALSVTKGGVVPQLESVALTMHNENRKLARKGDFVINSRSDRKGSAGVARQDGSVSTIYQVWKLTGLDPAFCDHLLRSVQFQEEFYRMGKGIVADLWTTGSDEMKLVELPLPPLPEQRAIAKFLARETAKIDTLVEEQRKLIELLKEKRQALITQAVTKGLDPTVNMKDSGIEWLGEVPEHWRLGRLSSIGRISGGGTPSRDNPEYWGEDIAWVSSKDVKSAYISDAKEYITDRGLKESSTKLVDPGSVIMVVRSGILQHTLPVAVVTKSVAINQDIKAIMFNEETLVADYFCHFVNGYNDQLLNLWQTQGATVESIDVDLMRKSLLPMPPVNEQRAIVERLSCKLELFESLIHRAETSSILLKERRSALISATVTGKIDVRDMIDEEVKS